MIYVALLRGINVGGNRKVDMKRLATTFEQAGMHSVTTYINSGNVIFQHETTAIDQLTAALERAIAAEFGFQVDVLLRTRDAMRAVAEALPATWKNDTEMKCDVIYLRDEFNSRDTLNLLPIRPAIDTVHFVDGALLWRVDRQNMAQSGLTKIIGTALYKNATVRNCNTTRKLYELMQ